MVIEGRLCRQAVTSLVHHLKFIFIDDLHTIFLYLISNWGYIENCEIFKYDESPIIHRDNRISRVHLHIKFSDHMLKRFRVIAKNVTLSIKHSYKRPTLSSRCDVTGDTIIMKFIFMDDLHTIFWYLMSTWGYIEIAKFSKVTKIWGPGELFRHNNHRKLDILSR